MFNSSLSLLCTCSVGAAIPDIPTFTTMEDFGQVQKLALVRLYSSGTTKNKFTIASANPNLLASWTALTTASDGTKVQFTPIVHAPEFEPGEKREAGSGNEVANGIPLIKGSGPTTFSGMFKQVPQSVIKEIKKFGCENLALYLVNECGQIGGLADNNSSAPTEFYPIPAMSFFVGDKKPGGYDDVDSNALSWYFSPNWSDEFHVVKPTDFNPLTDF